MWFIQSDIRCRVYGGTTEGARSGMASGRWRGNGIYRFVCQQSRLRRRATPRGAHPLHPTSNSADGKLGDGICILCSIIMKTFKVSEPTLYKFTIIEVFPSFCPWVFSAIDWNLYVRALRGVTVAGPRRITPASRAHSRILKASQVVQDVISTDFTDDSMDTLPRVDSTRGIEKLETGDWKTRNFILWVTMVGLDVLNICSCVQVPNVNKYLL